VKHFKLVQPALDPEDFAQQTQSDADEIEHQTQREIQKHPERKEDREKYVEAYQKDAAEFLDFLSTRTLPSVQLDSIHNEVSGWILFSAKNKWIGGCAFLSAVARWKSRLRCRRRRATSSCGSARTEIGSQAITRPNATWPKFSAINHEARPALSVPFH
jgi:hypothetical protein